MPALNEELFYNLSQMEDEIGALMDLRHIHLNLSDDNRSASRFILGHICNHTHTLHELYYKAWPLIMKKKT